MKRNRFLIILSFCALLFFSLPAFAQTYYEFAYKDKAGKQCYGFMIYEDDDDIIMRVVEADKDNNVTASEDLKYKSEHGTEDGQKYTALVPTKEQKNAPYIVFFWGKQKDKDLIPMICFDLNKEDDFKDPDSFTEVGLADITKEYLQQFYDDDDPTYKSIMAAKNKVISQREVLKKSEGNDDDLYDAIMALLDETSDMLDNDSSCDQNDQGQDADDSNEEGGDDNYDQGLCSQDDGSNQGDSNNDSQSGNSGSADNNQNSNNTGNSGSNNPPTNGKVTLHFVAVINTVVQDIGASCRRDYDNILSEMQGIAKSLGIQFKKYDVMDADYSPASVKRVIKDLQPSANDVVFFLYSGHGFRFDDQKSRYPAMALNKSEYDDIKKNYLLMSEIYRAICAKKARLNIVLSDCCNTPIGINTPPMREDGTLFGRSNNNFSISRLGQLLLQERGNLLSTAASPGETSLCDMTGGFFTMAFIRALRKEINATNQQKVSWNTIINNTISAARDRSKAVGDVQNGLKESSMK